MSGKDRSEREPRSAQRDALPARGPREADPRRAPAPDADGRVRIVVESVAPSVDGGRFPAKRLVGETMVVEADCFTDGHDQVAARLLWRRDADAAWNEVPMSAIGNDRWRGTFTLAAIGRYRYTVRAWVDGFLSWRHDFARRIDADDLRVAAQVGATLVDEAAARAHGDDRTRLAAFAARLREEDDPDALRAVALDPALRDLSQRWPDDRFAHRWPVEMPLTVDRVRAGFSAWYELFPRSAGAPGRHGTLQDCEARLPYVAEMGFDVLYLPPIHPIGRERRKGKNNTLTPGPEDVGSPWAVGAAEGGHKAIHPALGTHEDLRRLVARAKEHGIELALDVAFQAAPDHPYVTEHPEWFRKRPDGSVQYAENPPKKYQDIYPFHFESDDWQALWDELASVFAFWIGEGVRIFRVDNPHTKPFPFWAWTIDRITREHPDVLFLSEAFTRPKVMHRLAKLGFSQSYTYFTWRNTKHELCAYFEELAHGPGADYFRPNCWPNTPDILPEYLQVGGRAAFMARAALAATLAANWGIYGPAFELMEHEPREPGSEEYRDSEKYQLRSWDLDRADSLAPFIARLNRARRENPALQRNDGLAFHRVDNEQLIAYSKATPDRENVVLVVVNLDPHHTQSGWIELDLDALGMEPTASYQLHDVLSGARYLWSGRRNYVQLDPSRTPAHVFRLRHRVRTEHAFDYFL